MGVKPQYYALNPRSNQYYGPYQTLAGALENVPLDYVIIEATTLGITKTKRYLETK